MAHPARMSAVRPQISLSKRIPQSDAVLHFQHAPWTTSLCGESLLNKAVPEPKRDRTTRNADIGPTAVISVRGGQPQTIALSPTSGGGYFHSCCGDVKLNLSRWLRQRTGKVMCGAKV